MKSKVNEEAALIGGFDVVKNSALFRRCPVYALTCLTLSVMSSDSLPTQHVTIDGIEGKHARVELPDGTTADWLLSILPEGVKEEPIRKV